jgi:hypothetical protein
MKKISVLILTTVFAIAVSAQDAPSPIKGTPAQTVAPATGTVAPLVPAPAKPEMKEDGKPEYKMNRAGKPMKKRNPHAAAPATPAQPAKPATPAQPAEPAHPAQPARK